MGVLPRAPDPGIAGRPRIALCEHARMYGRGSIEPRREIWRSGMTSEAATAWALVTGATGGLGRAFVRELAARGHPMLLVARRREELERLAREIERSGGRAEVVVADLVAPNGINTVAAAAAQVGGIDILVNNAGFGTFGPLLAHSPARDLDEVSLNV